MRPSPSRVIGQETVNAMILSLGLCEFIEWVSLRVVQHIHSRSRSSANLGLPAPHLPFQPRNSTVTVLHPVCIIPTLHLVITSYYCPIFFISRLHTRTRLSITEYSSPVLASTHWHLRHLLQGNEHSVIIMDKNVGMILQVLGYSVCSAPRRPSCTLLLKPLDHSR